MNIRRSYKNAETSTEPIINKPFPSKKEKLYSLLVLFILVFITFFPLVVGKNFIPFGKYIQWSFMLTQSSGQKLQVESSVLKRNKVIPWAEEPEVASLAIYWADSLYFAHNLKRGQFPLWDPYTGGGVPTIDNGQSRPFNPFRLPFYLFPTTWVYSLTLLAGLVFGGIGAYLWLLKQGFSLPAVTLGAGIFIFNPWVLERLVLTDSAAYFVLPWCLIALEQTLWRNWASISRTVLCFILMGHSGHPEASIMMAAVAITVFLFNRKGLRNYERSFVNRAKTAGAVAMLTLVCLTMLWLPFLRLLTIGDIYKKHAWFLCEYSWRSLITLPSDMFIAPAVGAILICSFLAWRRIPKVWMALLAIVVLILFPLPWIGTMFSRLLSYHLLPSFYLKSVFWASLSFLLPYGLEAYKASNKSIAIVTFIIGGAMLIFTGLQFASIQMAKSDISTFPILAFLLLSMGILALVFFRTTQTRLFPLLISAIILIPLAFPLSLNKLSWSTVDFKTNSVIEWLKINRPNARTVSIEPSFMLAIPPNFGQAYEIRCVEVTTAIFLNNYRAMFQHPRAAMPTTVTFSSYYPGIFRQMGADILLLANNISSGLDPLIKGTQFSAYSIPGAHGRLYFAEWIRQYEPDMDLGKQVLSLNQNTDAVAVVEEMGTPVPPVIHEVPSGKGKAFFEKDDAGDILVCTECSSEGLLVLRDSWYPGWIAFIDGKRNPIFRVNGCFRGVIVPAGEHRVRFVYRPILAYISGLVSLLALLVVVFISIQKGGRSKQSSDFSSYPKKP